jgi:hypothetical protein
MSQAAATVASLFLASLQRLAGVPIPGFAERHDQIGLQLYHSISVARKRQQEERLIFIQQGKLQMLRRETLAFSLPPFETEEVRTA